MSWNLLAYAIPLFGGIKTFSACIPSTYRKYEESSESLHSVVVKEVADRALSAEINSKGNYQKRIQEMIQELPDSISVRNLKAVLDRRLRVVSIKNDLKPIHSIGTDLDIGSVQGKFFIGIDPRIEKTAQEALPWIVTHEICHILEDDWVEIPGIKTIASLSATILSTFVFGWGLIPSTITAIGTNFVTHVILSHRAENRADDFANHHCLPQEREKAMAYFEHIKNARSQQRISAFVEKIILSIFYSSYEERIGKIRGTLA